MSQLLEHILNEDYVSANQLFEKKMLEIQEKKMLAAKKMIQAEALGGLTRAEIEDRKKRGYKKAADVLPDPRDIKINPLVIVKKKKMKEAVEVQPDPEGKIRGGTQNPVKGTMKRKVLASVVKGVRKASRVAGSVAGDIAVASSRLKSMNADKQAKRSAAAAEYEKMDSETKPALRKISPDVYRPKGLRQKLQTGLEKARELDARAGTPGERESKVKAAYYSTKARRAASDTMGALQALKGNISKDDSGRIKHPVAATLGGAFRLLTK